MAQDALSSHQSVLVNPDMARPSNGPIIIRNAADSTAELAAQRASWLLNSMFKDDHSHNHVLCNIKTSTSLDAHVLGTAYCTTPAHGRRECELTMNASAPLVVWVDTFVHEMVHALLPWGTYPDITSLDGQHTIRNSGTKKGHWDPGERGESLHEEISSPFFMAEYTAHAVAQSNGGASNLCVPGKCFCQTPPGFTRVPLVCAEGSVSDHHHHTRPFCGVEGCELLAAPAFLILFAFMFWACFIAFSE